MKPQRGLFTAALVLASTASTQPAERLTLAQAEAAALKNHPRLAAARATAQASKAAAQQSRAPLFPAVSANLTGVGAQKQTVVAAGNITTSALANRVATGVIFNQMLLDFGRTSNLIRSAELQSHAQGENIAFTRAELLLRVRQAYFRGLAAQAVLRVARDTVEARRLTLRQVTALAKSNLKSSLDVSFADVNVSDAELGLVRAENDLQSALAELTAAMGSSSTQELELVEEPDPPPLAEPLEYLIAAALRERPDLASLRLQQQAAQSFARSERRLWLPTLSAMGSAGVLPGHEESLPGRYSAVGLNLSLPVLNGGLFSARKAEAEARAEAASQQVRDLELMIARDVKLARLNAETAFRRLQVTARLAEQAARSLKLAQARYDLGLGSIVELTQAQLNKTSAEIASANARYEYQLQRSVLDYQTGALK